MRGFQTKEKNTSHHRRQSHFGAAAIFPKLSINAPGDAYEHQADAMADKVMRMEEEEEMMQAKPLESGIQRKCAACAEEEENLQAKPLMRMPAGEGGYEASPVLREQLQRSKGSGGPLPDAIQARMGRAFGADFSNVRVHTGGQAAAMSQSIQAKAFTHGSDVYFNKGQYQPGTSAGGHLLAHELAHVVQQGAANPTVQRNCHDGDCSTCSGGERDFWITFYFRRRATRETMRYLRGQINGAKTVLKNCCLNLKADFNWTLLPGATTFNFLTEHPDGSWNYSPDASALGTGNTFSGSRGIPVLVVDDVPQSGGGVTVDTRFDATYTGRTYAVIGVNQPNPNPNCNHLAHELWHISSGIVGHDPRHGTLAACSGNSVSPEYCNGLRNIVAPVGDFPLPVGDTTVV